QGLDRRSYVPELRPADALAGADADPFLKTPTTPTRHFRESARDRSPIGRGGRQRETLRRLLQSTIARYPSSAGRRPGPRCFHRSGAVRDSSPCIVSSRNTEECNANALRKNDLADGHESRDDKNLSRTDLLTSFPTDPLKSTSLAIQDSDALKDLRPAVAERGDTKWARFLE